MQLRDALNTSDKQQRGAKISQLESTIEGEFAKISGSGRFYSISPVNL